MIRRDYDVIVVGSGVGGMSAAALLAHGGYRVLVAERLPRLGGRFSTTERRGFKLGTGGYMVEMGGPFERVFHEVGAPMDVAEAGGSAFHVRGGFLEVPEKGRFGHLIACAADDGAGAQRVLKAFDTGMRWAEPSASISVREWLAQYTRDEKIIGIFQWFISGFAMVNVDECPANELFRIMKRGPFRRAGIARNGSIALMEALASIVRAGGGEALTSCPVDRISIRNGKAAGAVVRHEGERIEISARSVISNGGPKKTVELAGPENFDRGYLKELRERERPASQMGIWIAADRPLFDWPFIAPTDGRRLNAISDLTAFSPALAPPGKRLLWAGASPGSSTAPVDPTEEIRICIEDLKEMLPGFDEHAEILSAQYFKGDFPGYRTWVDRALPEKTPVVNLYNVGDGVMVPGLIGTSRAAESAWMVVRDLVPRLQRSA